MRKPAFAVISVLICTLAVSVEPVAAATSLGGTSGLINVPSAQIAGDGEVRFGVSYVRKPYAVLGGPKYSNMAYYATMGYLPFLEISLRLTRKAHVQNSGFADRSPSCRVRVMKERAYLPALAFGVHDPVGVFGGTGSTHFNALYLVSSKTLATPFLCPVHLHLGVGTDWIEAKYHQLVGVFGGIDARINRFATLMAEYDAERVNAGIRLGFLSHIEIDLVLLDMQAISGGVSFSFKLD